MPVHTKIPKRWTYVGEVVAYLSKHLSNEIHVLDCLDPRFSHGEVLERVASREYFCVIMVCRFESIQSLVRLSRLIKEVDPNIAVMVYGDLNNYVPNFIKKEASIDALLRHGDWEIGIQDYVEYIVGSRKQEEVRGVELLIQNEWQIPKPGAYLAGESWEFTDLRSKTLSADTYFRITKGELTITVSRGCPFNCRFCSAVSTFGSRDRRKKVSEVVDYIEENKRNVSSFKLFSPTLTHNKEWVKEFCRELIQTGNIVRWCGTTRPDCLNDKEMVQLMSESGCHKIAMGIETMDDNSVRALGKYHGKYSTLVESSITLLRTYGIEAKALLMIGIKGQTAENIKSSFSRLEKWGASLRTAAYSPREALIDLDKEGSVTYEDIRKFDKMTYQHCAIDGLTRNDFLNLIYRADHFRELLH